MGHRIGLLLVIPGNGIDQPFGCNPYPETATQQFIENKALHMGQVLPGVDHKSFLFFFCLRIQLADLLHPLRQGLRIEGLRFR